MVEKGGGEWMMVDDEKETSTGSRPSLRQKTAHGPRDKTGHLQCAPWAVDIPTGMLPLGSPYEKFLSIGFLPILSEQFGDLNMNNAATHQDFTLTQVLRP